MANRYDPVATKDRIRLTVRLKPEDHKALRRMAFDLDVSINNILDILVSKSIPARYYKELRSADDE